MMQTSTIPDAMIVYILWKSEEEKISYEHSRVKSKYEEERVPIGPSSKGWYR